LDTEISNRIAAALAGSRVDATRIERGQSFTPQGIYDTAVRYLDNFFITDSLNPRDFSIFPEYRIRGFRSLVFELSTVVAPAELPELRDALRGYEQLADLGSIETAGEKVEKKKSLEAATNATKMLKNRVLKPRWVSRMDNEG
jgi:hypothetical protein